MRLTDPRTEWIASHAILKRMLGELWRLTDAHLEALREAVATEGQPSARARSEAKRARQSVEG